MTVAVFNYAVWAARYPEFSCLDQATADALFAEAGLYCDNTDCGVIPCDPVTYQPRLMLLGMVTAHLASLMQAAAKGNAGVVGRLSAATQGSVSVSMQYDASKADQWFAQTQYGATYWQATAQYRTMTYLALPGTANGAYAIAGVRRWPYGPYGGWQ